MLLQEPDRLFVIEESQIHAFVIGEDGWRFDRTISLEMTMIDACIIGSTLYVLSVSPLRREALHRVDLPGMRYQALATPYQTEDDYIRFMMVEGYLRCLEEEDLIVFAPLRLPEIHGYRRDGALAWKAKIPGHEPMMVMESADGSGRVPAGLDPRRDEMHVLHRIVRVIDTEFVLQVAVHDRTSLEQGLPYSRLRTFTLDAGRGTMNEWGTTFREIADATANAMLVADATLYPRLSLFRLGER